MYAVSLVLKNNRKVDALIWSVPKDGIMTILDESNGRIKNLKLSDIEEGKIWDDRIRGENYPSYDLFDKIEENGWK